MYKTKMMIELDDKTAESFKHFCQYEAEMLAEHERWKELKVFAKKMQFGTFALSVKDGVPYKVENPMQTFILGIKI